MREGELATTATVLNNLGTVLRMHGAGRIEIVPRKGIENFRKIQPDHPNVAAISNNLGLTELDQKDREGSKAHVERALQIAATSLGTEHPTVRTELSQGSVLQAQKELAGARALYEQALRIADATLGPEQPELPSALSSLGAVVEAQGDAAGACALYEPALQTLQKQLGEDHPSTIAVRARLQVING